MSSPLARLRARAEPAPSYALRHAYAGVHRLSTSVTINGQVRNAVAAYAPVAAYVSTDQPWLPIIGEQLNVTGAGAAPVITDSVFSGPLDGSCQFQGAKYYRSVNANFLTLPVNRDIIVEMVMLPRTSGATRTLLSNAAWGGAYWKGWALTSIPTANVVGINLFDGVGATGVNGNTSPDSISHMVIGINRDEASANGAKIWINAVAGVGADLSARNNAGVEISGGFRIGHSDIYGACVSDVLWVCIWSEADLIAAGAAGINEVGALAAQRLALLTGGPTVAAGSSLPDVMTRTSPTHVDKWIGANRRIFYVGANWPALHSRKDSAGRTLVGIAPDIQRTNLCLQSQTLNTTWTKVALTSITNDSGVGPNGTSVLDGLIGDATDAFHGVSQVITLTAASYCIDLWVLVGNKGWAYIDDTTVAGCTGYFDLATGVVGTKGAGANSIGIEDWGGGLFHCWITLTGTAAPHTIRAGAAHADLDNDFAGDAATINVHMGCIQVAAGNVPAAYIPTTTGAVTKTAENHRYPGLANIGGIGSEKQDAIRFKVLVTPPFAATIWPNPVLLGLSDGGTTADQIIVYFALTENIIRAQMNATGGATKIVYSTVNALDGVIHDCMVTWGNGRLQLFVDGGIAANGSIAITSADIPDELDRLHIGEHVNGNQQGGILISDVKVFPRPLHSPIVQGSGFRD